MYTFQGVSVSRQKFWELTEIAKYLVELEKKLDEESGFGKQKEFVKELTKSIPKQRKNNNLRGHSFCKDCGAKMVLTQNQFTSFFRCSNLNCIFVEGVVE